MSAAGPCSARWLRLHPAASSSGSSRSSNGHPAGREAGYPAPSGTGRDCDIPRAPGRRRPSAARDGPAELWRVAGEAACEAALPGGSAAPSRPAHHHQQRGDLAAVPHPAWAAPSAPDRLPEEQRHLLRRERPRETPGHLRAAHGHALNFPGGGALRHRHGPQDQGHHRRVPAAPCWTRKDFDVPRTSTT